MKSEWLRIRIEPEDMNDVQTVTKATGLSVGAAVRYLFRKESRAIEYRDAKVVLAAEAKKRLPSAG